MKTKHAEATKPTKARAQRAKGEWTKAALAKKAASCAQHREMVASAAAYARAHGYGAKKTLAKAGGHFPGVTYNVLHKALKGSCKYAAGERHKNAILTQKESDRLVEWMQARAQNTNPCMDAAVSEKVVEILRARWAANKKLKHSKKLGCVPLSDAEHRLVFTRGAEVSHVWLQRLAARRDQEIEKKGVRNADATRSKKQNEGVVNKHFYGEYGLEAELLGAGIMDPESKQIKDPRRVLWTDEMPQVTCA